MLKFFKPTTPSQRNLIKIINNFSHKNPLLKSEVKGFKNSSGRNNQGKITTRHKGGGHKRNYRVVDFKKKNDENLIVISLEYDPNRTANIAAVYDFMKRSYSYVIAPKNLKIGDIIKAGKDAELKLGHVLKLLEVPEGTEIHNVWCKSNKSATLSRAAGTFCKVVEKNEKFCKLKLSSGLVKNFSLNCICSVGVVSNELHEAISVNKAGRARWLNRRPTVRGVAMNPVDHPHGGGEGKKSGHKLTPWG